MKSNLLVSAGIGLLTIVCIIIYFTNDSLFDWLVREDSLAENLTAIFLFLTSFYLIYILIKNFKHKKNLWRLGVFLMAMAFFFGAGEEISWGQRIFDIESSDYFKENNAQQETNLHNMVVDGKKINKIIFSNVLSIVFGVYFLILPFLYRKKEWAKSLVNQFGVMIPSNIQVITFLTCTLILLLIIGHSRKWELWEALFSITILWISIIPFNKKEIHG